MLSDFCKRVSPKPYPVHPLVNFYACLIHPSEGFLKSTPIEPSFTSENEPRWKAWETF